MERKDLQAASLFMDWLVVALNDCTSSVQQAVISKMDAATEEPRPTVYPGESLEGYIEEMGVVAQAHLMWRYLRARVPAPKAG